MQNVQDMTREELIAALEKKQTPTVGGLKVSAKGAVSLYGVGRWPVTLYASQWKPVIELVKSGTLEKFLEDNASKLAVKADKE